MSKMLRGTSIRVPKAKNSISSVYSRDFSTLRCSIVRRNGTLPLEVKARKVESRQYLSTTNKTSHDSNSTIKNSRHSNKLSSSKGPTEISDYRITSTISKRHQHSQAQESTVDIDHAPILASYPEWIKPQDTLPRRHIGPSDEEISVMLKLLDQPSLDAFIKQTIPDSIRAKKEFSIPSEQTPETEMLDELTKAGKANSAAEVDTYIGMGYHPTITPGVIKRNVLENPGWYTSYTPYQPEISQGTIRLRSWVNKRSFGKFIELSNCNY